MKARESPPSVRLTMLRSKLDTEIPVTQTLGIQVIGIKENQVVLWAPLEKNRNHQGTAFAGSVSALATLAGWASVWLTLAQSNVETSLVIQDSFIKYSRPVTHDFLALCSLPKGPAVEHLIEAISRHGRGRIKVEVSVVSGDKQVATFEGRYVALANGNKRAVTRL